MSRFLTLLVACALLLAGCGDDAQEPPAGEQEQPQEAAPATIEVASSPLGDILVDSDGMTLYMFVPDQDQNGEPTCYDDCAATWPPLEAAGEPTVGEGLDQSLLATAERTDDTTQVTYNGLPLYNFSGDEAAGDTNGQGLSDVWWVVSADGNPVME
jgi:predicted lipoprotein with Yx(FWY)xxD motif